MKDISEIILRILREEEALTVKELTAALARNKIGVTTAQVNSLVYGTLRDAIVRDVNAVGIPTWRIRSKSFEAGKGLEVKFCQELLKQHIVRQEEVTLDHEITNRKSGKIYHPDIAIYTEKGKYDIEIDGLEHMRADAKLSIQEQIEKRGEKTPIEIDWMDNTTSYVELKYIDNKKISMWFNKNLDWCVRYHEELIWPHDIRRNIWLIENGWQVMRLWNEEVRSRMKESVQSVKEWIK